MRAGHFPAFSRTSYGPHRPWLLRMWQFIMRLLLAAIPPRNASGQSPASRDSLQGTAAAISGSLIKYYIDERKLRPACSRSFGDPVVLR